MKKVLKKGTFSPFPGNGELFYWRFLNQEVCRCKESGVMKSPPLLLKDKRIVEPNWLIFYWKIVETRPPKVRFNCDIKYILRRRRRRRNRYLTVSSIGNNVVHILRISWYWEYWTWEYWTWAYWTRAYWTWDYWTWGYWTWEYRVCTVLTVFSVLYMIFHWYTYYFDACIYINPSVVAQQCCRILLIVYM